MSRTRQLIGCLLAVAAGLVGFSGAAFAQSAATEAAQVNAVLAANPTAHQRDASSVEFPDGTRFIAAPRIGAASPAASCRRGAVCIYSEPNFTGFSKPFVAYGGYNLAAYYMPNGVKWAHQTSSYINNQTGGAKANFARYDATGGYFVGIDECRAYCAKAHLGSIDNMIDKVTLTP